MGGVVVNPRRLSSNERQGLTRRYATEISLLIGPDRDIRPGCQHRRPDHGLDLDTFSMHRGHTIAGVVTGKPQAIGGTRGRREATSRGAFRCIAAARVRAAWRSTGRASRSRGSAGSAASWPPCSPPPERGSWRLLTTETRWPARRASTLPRRPRGWPATTRSPAARNTEPIERADIFATDCDIVVSAGLQNQVTAAAAAALRAGLLAEAGNSPTTAEADATLRDRGVLVIPDILCTAGGLVLGYFEWVQDMQAFFWAEGEVGAELDRIMDEAFAALWRWARRTRSTARAAMMVAVGRVARRHAAGLYRSHHPAPCADIGQTPIWRP